MTDFGLLPGDAEEDGTTPLAPDERQGLKLPHIQTRAELNAVEQSNVQQCLRWLARQRRFRGLNYLSEEFLLQLHKQMLGEVWEWAGHYRNSEKSVGIYPGEIGAAVRVLLEDAYYWIEQSTWNREQFAARFHHRLEEIHPFPNGNGRHGRIMTDTILTEVMQAPPVNWLGSSNNPEQRRADYIDALRNADAKDYALLERFMEA